MEQKDILLVHNLLIADQISGHKIFEWAKLIMQKMSAANINPLIYDVLCILKWCETTFNKYWTKDDYRKVTKDIIHYRTHQYA